MKLIIKLIKIIVRIFAAIVLLLILIVAIGLTIQHFTTKKAYKYHISQIQAERIALCDSFAHGINLYKLSFETVPTGYKHGLFVGGIEPYLEGCADSLTNITFMTTPQASGNVLSPLQIKGNKVEALTLQECTGKDTIDGDFYDNTKDLGAFLQKGRHHLENPAHSSRMEVPCLSPRPNILGHCIASSSDLRMDNLYAKSAKARPKPTSSKAS